MHSPAAHLRRALTATLAVLLALPAVGLACPPEMRDACPLMTPEPPAEECPMGAPMGASIGSMSGHGEHSSAEAPSQSLGRGLPSCCVSDASGTPTAPATATTRIETPGASVLPTALPAPTLATITEAQAHAPPNRAPAVPLYTLHSSLLS